MIKDEHTHNLGLKKAVAQLQLLAKDLQERYAGKVKSFSTNWQGTGKLSFSISYMRVTVAGKIWVTDDKAIIEYDLPFFFRKMATLISSRIKARFERYFPFDHGKQSLA